MSRGIEGIFGKCYIGFLQSGPTKNEICVYVALSSFQGGKANCWPGIEAIVERGFSDVYDEDGGIKKSKKNMASAAIQALVESGWVHKKRRPNNSSVYVVMGDFTEPKEIPETQEINPETQESLPGNPEGVGPKRTSKRTIEKTTVSSKAADELFPESYTQKKPAKPKAKSKKASTTNPDHPILLKYFCSKFLEATNQKYSIEGKEGGQIAMLLKRGSLEECKAKVDLAFQFSEQSNGSGYWRVITMGNLLSRWNEIVVDPKEKVDFDWREQAAQHRAEAAKEAI